MVTGTMLGTILFWAIVLSIIPLMLWALRRLRGSAPPPRNEDHPLHTGDRPTGARDMRIRSQTEELPRRQGESKPRHSA